MYLVNWVFKTGIALIFIAAGIQANTYAQSTPKFDSLKSMFEDGHVFNAEFTHQYNDGFTGEQQTSEGEIWIGREQYKIEGENQQMLVDGDISRVYDSQKNRVIISEYIEEEDDFAPSKMLQGVDSTFSVTEQSAENNETLIRMISNDPFSIFAEVSIYLNENDLPVRIRAVDQVDNELITTFMDGKFEEETAQVFQLSIPDDAEQVDLRYES